MLIKTENNCELHLHKEQCKSPNDLTQFTFSREMLDEEGIIINQSNFKLYLTTEETEKLKQAL